MIFEQALQKMREGHELGLEINGIVTGIYKVENQEIKLLRSDGEWVPVYLGDREIFSNGWYIRG